MRSQAFDLEQLYRSTEDNCLYNAVHEGIVERIHEQQVWIKVPALESQNVCSGQVAQQEWADEPPQVGQRVQIYVGEPPTHTSSEQPEPLKLSVWRARLLTDMQTMLQAKKQESFVPGCVVGPIKGGYSVALLADGAQQAEQVQGYRAFLPQSFAGLRAGQQLDPLRVEQFLIKHLQLPAGSIVVSLQESLQQKRQQQQQEGFARLKVGDVVEGKLQRVMPYGVFVDLDGASALLRNVDMAWYRRARADELPRTGEPIRVRVTQMNPQTHKIYVSRKHLVPDPWKEDLQQRYGHGEQVEGRVVALTEFGAFVQLQEGLEGLVHNSELSWIPVKHPSQCVQVGQTVQVRVLAIDLKNRRISLSMKALQKSPAEVVAQQVAQKETLTARVMKLENFGVFLQLDQGVHGFMHVSELSWTKRVQHPKELLQEGQQIQVTVLDVDARRQRVTCSMKRTKPDPWKKWKKIYGNGTHHKVRVLQVSNRGLLCTLQDDLTGFCPSKELSNSADGAKANSIKVGDEIDVAVLSCDSSRCQIMLSMRQRVVQQTRRDYEDYLKRQKEKGSDRITLGSVLQATQKK
ncbi:MAG: S1 RNA-binding domain-containing protein [Myxococcota bacterium]